MTALRRTAAVAALVVLGALAGLAGAPGAGAQVEIDATEVPAGSRTTLNFTVVTGCGSSPTMEVAVTMPEGTFDIVPIPPPGFTTLLLDEGAVVVFQGGPLEAETPATFGIEMVTPNLPGVTVLYPVEQTCVDDTISWSDTNAGRRGRCATTAADAPTRARSSPPPPSAASTTVPGGRRHHVAAADGPGVHPAGPGGRRRRRHRRRHHRPGRRRARRGRLLHPPPERRSSLKASTASSRSARARATRLRIVPTGTPHTLAASS